MRGFAEAASPFEAVQAVRTGLPVTTVDALLESGQLTAAELDRLAIPRKTLAHRRQNGRLSPEQSDRLLRIMRVLELAGEVFGNPEKAKIWLRRPSKPLRDQAPLDLLDTDIGAREVEKLLGHIAHGIAA